MHHRPRTQLEVSRSRFGDSAVQRRKQSGLTQPRFSFREIWSSGSSHAAADEMGMAAWIRSRLDEICPRQFLVRYPDHRRLGSNCTAPRLLAVPFEISFRGGARRYAGQLARSTNADHKDRPSRPGMARVRTVATLVAAFPARRTKICALDVLALDCLHT